MQIKLLTEDQNMSCAFSFFSCFTCTLYFQVILFPVSQLMCHDVQVYLRQKNSVTEKKKLFGQVENFSATLLYNYFLESLAFYSIVDYLQYTFCGNITHRFNFVSFLLWIQVSNSVAAISRLVLHNSLERHEFEPPSLFE